MHEQLYKATGNTRFNDSLDFVIGTIRKIGNGPASINQNLVIQRVDKLGQDWQSRENLLNMLAYHQSSIDGADLTVFQSGCGVFPRQKLLKVQVALRSMLNLRLSPNKAKRGLRAPQLKT